MSVHHLHDEIVVAGWSCRLPGANSIARLWSLLLEGRCAVSEVPADRFHRERFLHPRRGERGKSYTWAAGIIDDPWGFDPAVFSISPREAEVMDPQQRILLQLAWEALEDAGIPPSSLAGTDTGVFVGGSLTEYANSTFADPALIDVHFGTGNALALLSNRISHAFDLHGPSMTFDTACSSSLVALHQAAEALRTGRVNTAIVGGINIIASHTSFISFSQAGMLSPTGLCRAFDAKADGFVRAEGGVALVLRKGALAQSEGNSIHGVVLASDVNSDGRTNGVSLPSAEAQENLLKRVYVRAGIDPTRLAFVEAHGTGTPVGDPVEAMAIGRALGEARDEPLPIGSIKTNVGHLEPASGLAGVLKALLALNHGILPPSLHFTAPNPAIDFTSLNLAVCTQSRILAPAEKQCAGVNSFGFGGTNAHVVLGPGRKAEGARPEKSEREHFFFVSAETKPALAQLAGRYAETIGPLGDDGVVQLAGAAAYRRDRLTQRVVVTSTRKATVAQCLEAYEQGREHPNLVAGPALGRALAAAFVYSGNGAQWAGMGTSAYRRGGVFRAHFDRVNAAFAEASGWSLVDALFDPVLEQRLPEASVAQPLIFAIQCATTAALAARGFVPGAVLGHSVGEVAAAEAAGILDLNSAVRLIYHRSRLQERVRGNGRMAAISAPPETAAELARAAGAVEIAATNSPRTTTVAGPAEAIAALKAIAADRGVPFLDLGLDYPFHTEAMAPIERPLLADLSDLAPDQGSIPFISTVTGACVPGSLLDAGYWWRNVREPVQFMAAIRQAHALGVRLFVEIGPRNTLLKHIIDSFDGDAGACGAIGVFERGEREEHDAIDKAVARALVAGAAIDDGAAFGAVPHGAVRLPTYPWQQQPFRYRPTPEAIAIGESGWHPLAGTRWSADEPTWHAHIDTALIPAFIDHRVGAQTWMPGTAFIEIAFAVARLWLKSDRVTIANFEILRPLDLSDGRSYELMSRVAAGANVIEISSRPRLSQAAWTLNARGKILPAAAEPAELTCGPAGGATKLDGAALYEIADATGLHYGPQFRLARSITCSGAHTWIELASGQGGSPYLADPIRVDATLHGMFHVFPELASAERGVAYVPTQLERATVHVPFGTPARALLNLRRKSERSLLVDVSIADADGRVLIEFEGAHCQAVPVRPTHTLASSGLVERFVPAPGALAGGTGVPVRPREIIGAAEGLDVAATHGADHTALRLLDAWATAAAYQIVRGLGARDRIDPDQLVEDGGLAAAQRPWLIAWLNHLAAAGLAHKEGAAWKTVREPSLPRAADVLCALAQDHPERAADLLLAGEVTMLATGPGRLATFARPGLTTAFHALAAQITANATGLLARLLRACPALFPAGRSLRVLQAGGKALLELDGNVTRHDRLDDTTKLEPASYDLVVAANGLHALSSVELARLARALAPGGTLLALEAQPSLFNDMALGIEAGWFARGESDDPRGPLRSRAQWQMDLAAAGFAEVEASEVSCSGEPATLLAAQGPDAAIAETAAPSFEVLADTDDERSRELVAAMAARCDSAGTDDLIYFVPSEAEGAAPGQIATHCLAMRAIAARCGDERRKLWLVFAGARTGDTGDVSPVAAATWAFSRTLANETPNLDMRRIDVPRTLAAAGAAERLVRIVASGTDETELQLGATETRVLRVSRTKGAAEEGEALRLHAHAAGREHLRWETALRRAPGPGEIEIEVRATGLNFRDVMWHLSLVPETMLEGGFAGPTLGLECAGTVVRVGEGVRDLAPGDRVTAFAGSAFATHVTIPAPHAAPIPERMSFAAAATIPVAFLTAAYALVTLARLRRGEWVLIHGGAGGVGMAAIQIARARGAKLIATAGSSAKRSLLRALGVRHVFDSRTLAFANEVRRLTGDGVDVVLNSLAGEAMEHSIACLKPFGRFCELGKRDYIGNTHVGLRPFRKNLTYFGIDLDQILGNKGSGARGLLRDIIRRMDKGSLVPLPHTVFAAADTADAFHLMQQSGHIGKIVLEPPPVPAHAGAITPFAIDPARTHLVTGAFGGFGREVAKWLVKAGARNLVLLGRRGVADDAAKALVASLEAKGARIMCDPCDVSDFAQLQRVFEKIARELPPLAGVIHAAMVLDDATAAKLDAERFRRVLAPKALGAEHLDRLTAPMALDYLVLFSSVTTLIGNPGQGNYVAANAYMEALAWRRRRRGLPALAIGWGPITDVGVVARSEKLRAGLERVTGGRGMTSLDALQLMAAALAPAQAAEGAAVITIAPSDHVAGTDRLATLRSPSFAALANASSDKSDEPSARIDLAELVRSEKPEEVRGQVSGAITAQLADVLHARAGDIDRLRPLGELGVDSLMALELGMSLERVFGLRLSLAGASGELTVARLTEEIILQAAGGGEPSPAAEIAPIAQIHAASIAPREIEQIEALMHEGARGVAAQ